MSGSLAVNALVSPARETWDVVVVGGGPAGLAAAIVGAEQGLSVLVLERRSFPPDKACGEGILPPGVRALERLGVRPFSDATTAYRFEGIRFVQENGSATEVRLPNGGGLGIRRTVLVEALMQRAETVGAVVQDRCAVSGVEVTRERAVIRTTNGKICARLVVAADGLHSPLRRAAGLEAASRSRRRFALRQHYRIRPWTDHVEVYVDRTGEGVVTPVSDHSVGVNYTWEDGLVEEPTIATLARRFPELQARLGDAPAISTVRGAGPMTRGATRRTSDRVVLIGDAAGFVDSISGDGLSVAFNSALIFGRHLRHILAHGASRQSMSGYEREARELFRRYWFVTSGMLWIARHPRVRRATLHYFGKHQALSNQMMSGAMRMLVSAV